jgi:hypothetical protein
MNMRDTIRRLTPDTDARLSILGGLTALLTLSVVVMAVMYGPTLTEGGTAAQEVRASAQVDNCRAQFRGHVDITRANLAVVVAEHATVVAEHNTALGEGLEAVVARDDQARDDALARLADLRSEIDSLNVRVDRAAARVQDAARNFQDAANLAAEDRPGFLDRCPTGQ